MNFNMDIDIDIDSDIDDNELQTLLRQFDNSTLIPIDISLVEKLLQEHEELENISENEPTVKPEDVTETDFDEQHNNQSRERDLHSEVANVGRNFSDVSEPRHSSSSESLHKDHNARQQDSSMMHLICDICRKSFARKAYLRVHVRSHSGETPYPCKECNKTFRQSIHLKIHQLVHTGEKPYSCQQCKKYFARKEHLRRHQLVHTGEKSYSCTECKKSFTQKANLKVHQRVHTGEKSYSCPKCKKSFTQKAHLKVHHRVHTGEKLHSCSLCKKPFAHKSSLNRHMMHSHKDDHRKL